MDIPFRPPPTDARGEALPCPRCGRIYERPVTAEVDGKPVRLAGHVPGGPVCLSVPPLGKGGIILDARARKAARSRL